jgi:hypothetical protein
MGARADKISHGGELAGEPFAGLGIAGKSRVISGCERTLLVRHWVQCGRIAASVDGSESTTRIP